MQRIIEALSLDEEFKKYYAPRNTILRKDTDGKPRRQAYNYQIVAGMVSCLASTSRPNVIFSVY